MVLQGVHHCLFGQDLQPDGDVGDHQVDLGDPVQAREKCWHFAPVELAFPSQLIEEGNLKEDGDGGERRVHLDIGKHFGVREGFGEDHQFDDAVDDGYDAKDESHDKSNTADHHFSSSSETQLVPLDEKFQWKDTNCKKMW